MPKTKRTRAEHNANWIEKYCHVPSGPTKGDHVRLTKEQKKTLADIYDGDGAPRAIPVTGEMGAYLALLHTVGREAPQGNEEADALPQIDVDVWTLWHATSPRLQEFVERDGSGAVICPGLGTRYPRRAA